MNYYKIQPIKLTLGKPPQNIEGAFEAYRIDKSYVGTFIRPKGNDCIHLINGSPPSQECNEICLQVIKGHRFGWLSPRAASSYGTVFYKCEHGSVIEITCVSDCPRNDEYRWEDKRLAGIVTEYHSGGLHSRYPHIGTKYINRCHICRG